MTINYARIKQLIAQLGEMINNNLSKLLNAQLNDDLDGINSAYNLNLGLNTIGNLVDDRLSQNNGLTPLNAQTNNDIDKSSKTLSNQDINRKRTLRFQHHNIGKRRISPAKDRGTHPAYLILRRVLSKDPKKLKDIMPRKMLLRVIY